MNNYVVYIHRRMDFRPFYIGYGRPDRAYDYSHRSDDWKTIRDQDGLIVQVLHSGLTRDEAKKIEAELIEGYRGILPGYLINKTDGVGSLGMLGEEHNSFLGFSVGISLDNKKFIVLAGARAIEEAGFIQSKVYACINGHTAQHYGMRWSRHDKLDLSIYEGMVRINHFDDLGINCDKFKGFSVGVSKCRTKFIILAGNAELAEAGFQDQNVSSCISGLRKSHKNFYWHRMNEFDPEFFAGMSPVDQRSADRLNQFKS